MRATKLYSTGDIRTVDVDVPSPAKDEILIKVEAAGICGTDRHLYHGEFPSVPGKILGHEFSGIVVDGGWWWSGRWMMGGWSGIMRKML